jgi:hypothetical protein
MRDNILMDNCFSKDTSYELRPYVTRDYIKVNNMALPKEDLPKLELFAFTNAQMKKLFI